MSKESKSDYIHRLKAKGVSKKVALRLMTSCFPGSGVAAFNQLWNELPYGPPGKMSFIEELLLAQDGHRRTKSEIVKLYMEKYPDVKKKTAINTVSWVASSGLRKKGLVSNHLTTKYFSTVGLTDFIRVLKYIEKIKMADACLRFKAKYPSVSRGIFSKMWKTSIKYNPEKIQMFVVNTGAPQSDIPKSQIYPGIHFRPTPFNLANLEKFKDMRGSLSRIINVALELFFTKQGIPAAQSPANQQPFYSSKSGRTAFIRNLRVEGNNWTLAWERILAKFPGSSIANCKKVWDKQDRKPHSGEPPLTAQPETLSCPMKGATGYGYYIPYGDGFVVLKGSTAVLQERASSAKWPQWMSVRRRLIADGTLVEKDGFYEFTSSFQFSSPSAAATVIHGGPANGLTSWRNKRGKTLKEIDQNAVS